MIFYNLYCLFGDSVANFYTSNGQPDDKYIPVQFQTTFRNAGHFFYCYEAMRRSDFLASSCDRIQKKYHDDATKSETLLFQYQTNILMMCTYFRTAIPILDVLTCRVGNTGQKARIFCHRIQKKSFEFSTYGNRNNDR